MWIAGAIIAGGITLSAVFRDHAEHAFDAQLLVYLDALVSVTEGDNQGRVVVMHQRARDAVPFALGSSAYPGLRSY